LIRNSHGIRFHLVSLPRQHRKKRRRRVQPWYFASEANFKSVSLTSSQSALQCPHLISTVRLTCVPCKFPPTLFPAASLPCHAIRPLAEPTPRSSSRAHPCSLFWENLLSRAAILRGYWQRSLTTTFGHWIASTFGHWIASMSRCKRRAHAPTKRP